MAAPTTEQQRKEFAAAYVNSSGDRLFSYRTIKPKTKSDSAADKGARRLLSDPQVLMLIEDYKQKKEETIKNVRKIVHVVEPETEQLIKRVMMTEIDLINQYVAGAMVKHSDYYMKNGKAKSLHNLTDAQLLQVKDITWSQPDGKGRRKVKNYVLEERSKAREQLARIMGITNQSFDFTGLLMLLTGKSKDEAENDIERLNHVKGVDYKAIIDRVKIIDGEVIND